MPIGFSAACAACKSPLRVEIDKRLLGGESNRAVSRWLDEQGEKISKDGLRRHRHEHVAIAEDLAERAAAADVVREAAIEKGLSRIERLQINLDTACEMRDLAAAAIRTLLDPNRLHADIPKSLVQLVIGSISEVRQNSQAVARALGEEPGQGDAAADADARESIARKLAQLVARRRAAEVSPKPDA